MSEGKISLFSSVNRECQGRKELTNPIHSNVLLVTVKPIDLPSISQWQRKAEWEPGGSAVRAELSSQQGTAAAS